MPTNATERLTVTQVQAEVERFWNAFTSKSAALLTQFYGPESTVFGSASLRSEPGRLAAARRQREYFHPQASIRVQLGPIEVTMLGESVAVASYTFQFRAERVAGAMGKTVSEEIRNGRATQIFALGDGSNLRIVHEHLSAVEKG